MRKPFVSISDAIFLLFLQTTLAPHGRCVFGGADSMFLHQGKIKTLTEDFHSTSYGQVEKKCSFAEAHRHPDGRLCT